MTEIKTPTADSDGYLRYCHELLLSGSVALAFLTTLLHTSNFWSGYFFGWEMGLNHSFGRRPTEGFGEYFAFVLWTFFLTMVMFLLFRLFSRVAFVAKILREPAGLIVIAAPAACFWIVRQYQPVLFDYAKQLWLLPVEESVAIIGGLLYARNRWRIPTFTTVFLLTLHSALWCRAYYLTLGFRGPHLLSVPIAAYLSILTWGVYLKVYRDRIRRQVASLAVARS